MTFDPTDDEIRPDTDEEVMEALADYAEESTMPPDRRRLLRAALVRLRAAEERSRDMEERLAACTRSRRRWQDTAAEWQRAAQAAEDRAAKAEEERDRMRDTGTCRTTEEGP